MKSGHLHRAHDAAGAARVDLQRHATTSTATASNPFDTNFGFANALLGVDQQLHRVDGQPVRGGRFNQVEFFVQDNWRVKRNFTIDVGVRFYYIGPTYVAGSDRSPTSTPRQLERRPRRRCSTSRSARTTRVRRDARGEESADRARSCNNTYIGKLVPESGDFYNGMRSSTRRSRQHRPFMAGAARRLRVGRDRRRQDRRPRRRAASSTTATRTT